MLGSGYEDMSMSPNEKELLNAINDVKIDVRELKTTVEKSVEVQFKDHDRRISGLENNQSKLAWAILSTIIVAVMAMILK